MRISSLSWQLYSRILTGIACTILVFYTFPAYAQLSSASVTGVVRDPSGSIVPEVKLTLRNLETSVERSAASNEAGNYVFLNVTPGRYTLEASKSGFQISQLPQFTLAVNQTATIDV